jgi:hypothetical protein
VQREWEEAVLKQSRHLEKMAMTAEDALSTMSVKPGQKQLHKTLAAMTDGQMLSTLKTATNEISPEGHKAESTAQSRRISREQTPSHQPRQPTTQSAGQFPATNEISPEGHKAESTAQSRRKMEGPKRAGQLDRLWGGKGTDSQAQPVTEGRKQPKSQAQPVTDGRKQPKRDRPPEEAPQA